MLYHITRSRNSRTARVSRLYTDTDSNALYSNDDNETYQRNVYIGINYGVQKIYTKV